MAPLVRAEKFSFVNPERTSLRNHVTSVFLDSRVVHGPLVQCVLVEQLSDSNFKTRMARRKGNGAMTVSEAGQKGGETTASTHDRTFYQQIGRMGGHKGGQRVRELIEEGKRAEGGE